MGGFTYFDGEIERALDFDDFRMLLGIPGGPPFRRFLGLSFYPRWSEEPGQSKISFPTITAAEIQDKARGDFLSKAIVILQSIWFIVQCIARGKQGLALTELELVTLALASLNGVMCYFWWDKPLGVKEPVKLYRKGREPAERVLKATDQVGSAMFPNVFSTYQILSSNERNVFAMLQDGALFRNWSVPLDKCDPHSLDFPVQCCLLVTFNSPRSITKRPPSLYQPSTHLSTNGADS